MALSDVVAFLDIGLEKANQFYTWGWRLSLGGAVVTAIGIGLLMWGTRVRDHDFETQVANLNLEAARAIERAGKLEERAAELEKDAARARADIAGANERAAKAEEKAAEANLELARLKAPRTLNPEQQERIVEKIRLFGGKQFDTASVMGDPEAGAISVVIEAVLNRAGWTQIDWKGGDIVFTRPGRSVTGIVTLTGVIIQMDPSQVPEFGTAAAALADALNAEGIFAKAEGGSGTQAENKNAMHVLVGKKP